MMRLCPYCDNKESRIVISINDYKIVKCGVCGFVYVVNPKSKENVEGAQNNTPLLPPVRKRHRQIQHYIDSNEHESRNAIDIAEIGAGFGGLASLMCGSSKYRYIGYEPNVKRANFCNKFNCGGVNGFYESGVRKYKYIILDNVLEHVHEPKELLCSVAEDVVPGGSVIIIVPNLYDVRRYSRAWRNRYHWRPHCHLNYFSKQTLFRMMIEAGLKPSMLGFAGLNVREDMPYYFRAVFDKIGFPLFGLSVIGKR